MKRIQAFLIFSGAMIAAQAQANLVVNGGFENAPGLSDSGTALGFYGEGELPGWHTSLGSTVIEVQQDIPGIGPSYEGLRHAELDSHGNSNAWQDIVTTPGLLYHFSFAYSPRAAVGEASNGIRFGFGGVGGVITADGINNTTTHWNSLSFTTLATSNVTRVYFEAVGVSDTVGGLIDNVSVTAVPEPETYALLGLGLGAVYIARRRRP